MPGKGQKRKRSQEGEGAEPAGALPSSALFSLSEAKLRLRLQRTEPDLRPLVLVANALRRLQDEMDGSFGPAQPQGRGVWLDPGRRNPSLPPTLDQLLLSSLDAAIFSSVLGDLTRPDCFSNPLCPPTAPPEDLLESGGTAQLGLSPVDLLGPEEGLWEEGLDSLFEDIDTSMYDCNPWGTPGKEVCSGPLAGGQGPEDLDYLLDVLVGAEEL